jgi:hypothetical protein
MWAAVLNAVMAASDHDVWAVGSGNPFTSSTTPPIVAHWDGVHWHVVAGVLSRAPDIGSDGLHAITALAPDDVWVAGEDGLIEHWDGTRWHIVASAEVPGGVVECF